MNPDDAYLRLVFEEAAQNQAGWTVQLDAKDKHGQLLHPWHKLYELVMETEGGLAVLAEIQRLRDEIERLERHLWRLTKVLNAGPVAYRAEQMPKE